MVPFTQIGVERFALLLGLSLFFGFAFEGFYADTLPRRPGGVRTFPLLALAGGSLYLLEPSNGAAFIAGLIVLGAWIYTYVRRQTKNADATEGLLIVPVCNLLAYLLGPIALTQPLWLAISVAVVAVLLLSGRHTLHDWAKQLPAREIITTGVAKARPSAASPHVATSAFRARSRTSASVVTQRAVCAAAGDRG